LPGKTNKPDEIVDIYSPTGYYIVVRITKSAEFPAEIHYREIRYGFPDYYIGKKRYVISRIKNTVRLWRQIRVYELNFDKLNDTGTGNDRSAVIVRRKTTGGGDTDLNGTEVESIPSTDTGSNNSSDTTDIWVEKFSEKHNKKYWRNTKNNTATWNNPHDPTKGKSHTKEGKSRTKQQPPVDESNDVPRSDDDDDQTINQPIKQKSLPGNLNGLKLTMIKKYHRKKKKILQTIKINTQENW
jgi:hypothetical protein